MLLLQRKEKLAKLQQIRHYDMFQKYFHQRCKKISLLIITYSTVSSREDSQMLQDTPKKIIDFLFQVFVTGNKICFGVLVWKHVERKGKEMEQAGFVLRE